MITTMEIFRLWNRHRRKRKGPAHKLLIQLWTC
uniref:HMG-box containing 4 n=1 Tax=Molossus molossus TaxID=27622 RepID=A0A7J8FXT9_MOLMO|nr:HMG-box containing 4 [Molossus molossus]